MLVNDGGGCDFRVRKGDGEGVGCQGPGGSGGNKGEVLRLDAGIDIEGNSGVVYPCNAGGKCSGKGGE